ncbi:MAG: hypothetical protein KC776_02675 [Myxococcales bacterium]|nr:hypothetical protein [Myxococcales bacterium]MCB9581189.1 hypothetical protein [Polyangiaceae bacterium]
MLADLVQVRPSERRASFVAFGTLLALMAGHALLETARDALFLAKLPATRLPLVYLGVAAIAVGVGRFAPRLRPSDYAALLGKLVAAAALGTFGFWLLSASLRPWALYAVYLWSALVASLVVTAFWLMLSERFTVTQAKRVYAFIGGGSVLGAVVGTAVAGVLSSFVAARHLLLCSALVFALSAAGPLLLSRSADIFAPLSPRKEHGSAREAMKSPYLARVAGLALIGTVTLTLVDYVFKSSVARVVPASELGSFFGKTYLALNLVSLGAQLFLVRGIVRKLGVTGALGVLPLLLTLGAPVLAVTSALWAALLLKGTDGSLRYSLSRTATELLFLPLPESARSSAKTAIDVVIQRGGQALASLGILAAVALDVPVRWLAAAVGLLALTWFSLSLKLRSHYLNLFRRTLQESAAQPRFRVPELDLSSLEAVIAALNSKNDAEVRAALDFLDQEQRARLIPALILYHPATDVVLQALDIFTRAERDDFVPIADRLLDHENLRVRAAALRARTVIAPDRALLERHAASTCPSLSATALVCLVANGFADRDSVSDGIEAILKDGTEDARLALADAIGATRATAFEGTLVRLSRDSSEAVRRATLVAMGRAPSARYLPGLTAMLEHRTLRAEARHTLVGLGEMALSFLSGALADDARPVTLRRHLPRTLMLFEPGKAARVLLEQLAVEQDGIVRYKTLRALGKLRARNPKLRLDDAALDDLIRRTVSRMYLLLEWRRVLEAGRIEDPRRATAAQGLLTQLLRDKETNGIERLFRLIGLRYPKEDVATIYRGFASSVPAVRASSRELVESLLEGGLQGAVLGLIDDAPDAERLGQAGSFHEPRDLGYLEVLDQLLLLSGDSLKSLAVYHVAEIGLSELRPRVQDIADGAPTDFLAAITQRALSSLASGMEG